MKKLALSAMLVLLLSCSLAAQAHPNGRFLEVLGNKLWVEDHGQGEPIILIPGGGGGSHDYYHPYFDELAKTHRVIYYDGFGRGKSPRASNLKEYSFDRDVEEVEALRKALGLGKVHVLGHSYAGYVAQGYAVKYPGSIRKLIVANGMVSGADYQAGTDFLNKNLEQYFPELWAQLMQLRAKGLLASSPEIQQAYFGSIGKMMEMFYFYDPKHASKIVFNEKTFDPATYYQLTGPDADFVIGGDLRDLDFSNKLNHLPFPVLVVGGRADGVVFPRLVKNVATNIPGSQLVFLETSGHFPFIEETQEFMRVLRTFLQK